MLMGMNTLAYNLQFQVVWYIKPCVKRVRQRNNKTGLQSIDCKNMPSHPREKGLRRKEESDFIIEGKPDTRVVVRSHIFTYLK
ncbi:Uncharacterised protein [Vibrio cholerae]|nr:hypothetical protein XV78_00700 [Vibrio cholerae]KQA64537.1 hypothetical protein XV81_07505 [Vibrio cholerae]KQA94549.1 hypothetical protein XV90_12020 [Vibrio cholerae]OEC20093.1 hypothetical protein BFX10_14195 [Vibrio cholerae]OFI91778.1 hypothetical protein BFX21_13945 [Vibrio cholerae]